MSDKADGTAQIHQCLLSILKQNSVSEWGFLARFFFLELTIFKSNFNALHFAGIYLSKTLQSQLWNLYVVVHHVRVQ